MPLFPRAGAFLGIAAGLVLPGPAAAQPFTPIWNGYYVGATGGISRDSASFDASDVTASIIAAPATITGFKDTAGNLGLVGGANWQWGALVFGFEGDWSRYWLKASEGVSVNFSPFPSPVGGQLSAEIYWAASLRARLGISAGNFLIYGTGGGIAAMAKANILVTGLGAAASYTNSTMMPGWVLGGGIEGMFTPHWIARAEFLHSHFGGVGTLTDGIVPASDRIDVNTVRAGLAYKF